MSAKPLTICPQDACVKKNWGKGKVKRSIGGGGGLIFKGSGFYITDYRSEGYKESAKKEAAAHSPPKEGASGGEGKKPAPGGEAKEPAPGSEGKKPAAGASGGGGSESQPGNPDP